MNIWLVPGEALTAWSQSGNVTYPTYANIECAHCGIVAAFNVGLGSAINGISMSVISRCPSCQENVSFFFLMGEVSVGMVGPVETYCSPALKKKFFSSDYGDGIPSALLRAIRAAVDSYNSKNYTATAVTGRRALEGLFKYLVDPSGRNESLFKLIEIVKKSSILAEPLGKLSHAIRASGNLGAHFDEDKEPTEEMARQIVELVDYMATYLYVLPKKITDLESQL